MLCKPLPSTSSCSDIETHDHLNWLFVMCVQESSTSEVLTRLAVSAAGAGWRAEGRGRGRLGRMKG